MQLISVLCNLRGNVLKSEGFFFFIYKIEIITVNRCCEDQVR